jgi:SagB-type dehydrogenase family enzyme
MSDREKTTVRAYHDATKHHFRRFARGPGHLDWASQPHPFRYYLQAPVLRLERSPIVRQLAYDGLYESPAGEGEPVEPRTLSAFFRYSLGLSAWKRFGASRWSLRVNPSSGNLHPTEGYALLGPVAGWLPSAGVYHYVPETHVLEVRGVFSTDVWERLMGGLPAGSFIVGLSSIHWREAWKYGERAFRYCQLDLGHAICALRFAACLCGWRLRLVEGWPHEAMAGILGLDRSEEFLREEREEPELFALVTPRPAAGTLDLPTISQFLDGIRSSRWHGKANRLSTRHVPWNVIDEVADATRIAVAPGLQTGEETFTAGWSPIVALPSPTAASEIILRRRSALAFDGGSSIAVERFVRILRRLLFGRYPPWDAIPWFPSVHLVFFVHRVTGLPRGIYILARKEATIPLLRSALRKEYLWERPQTISESLPFFLLMPGDCRALAARLSCDQEIAGDGYFSLAMMVEFSPYIQRYGAPFYRNLFWEAGLVGQVLYLEAEAAGGRGTGIGCYFDDPVHDLLGIEGHVFQDLYHFTMGMPVEDPRLTTLPPYPEEASE